MSEKWSFYKEKPGRYLSEKIQGKVIDTFPEKYVQIITEELKAIDATDWVKDSIIWSLDKIMKSDSYKATPYFREFVMRVSNAVIDRHIELENGDYK